MEKEEQGMACFAIAGTTEHDLQLAVDEFFSKCDGFMKVIKRKKGAWIVCYKTREQAEEAQKAMNMIKAEGIPL